MHDDTGFANCNLVILPGTASTECFTLDPVLLQPPPHLRTRAEPEDPWT